MITVSQLTKRYNGITAIENLSFTVSKGEIVGFLGPNGAGKTTTMKILTCAIPPSSGEAILNEFSIHTHSLEIRKHIGFLPEDNPLYFEMTVWEYMDFAANLRRMRRNLISKRIQDVVEICALQEVTTRPIGELSKGFQQRVGLAQSLLHEPEILILDEPTNGLDPSQMIDFRNLIKELGKKRTIVLCSHILSEVAATCSRVIILNKGKIAADGAPQELVSKTKTDKMITLELNQPLETVSKAFMQAGIQGELRLLFKTEEGFNRFTFRSSMDEREKIYSLSFQLQWRLKELSLEENSLESIFMELTKE